MCLAPSGLLTVNWVGTQPDRKRTIHEKRTHLPNKKMVAIVDERNHGKSPLWGDEARRKWLQLRQRSNDSGVLDLDWSASTGRRRHHGAARDRKSVV